jgi:hypothetical protein
LVDIRTSPDANGERVRLKQTLWSAESVGNLYVFKGGNVPALLEIFTSPICEDYARLRRWLGLWFSTPEGADTVAPPMVPLVYHVTDQGDGLGERLGKNEYTKRRNSYQRQWAMEAEQSLLCGGDGSPLGSGHGTCYVMNGEYVPLRELEKMDMMAYHKSKSKGVLKVLLADETTVLATYQPMDSIKAMVGNLVANVAVVGCGAKCTCHGHQPHRSDTHHSLVLASYQVPLVKQECQSYHVAGITLSRPNVPGMESLGIVVWVTHGFIDCTPMAVGYCGLGSPNST